MRTLQLRFERSLNDEIRPSRRSAWATTKCLLWCGKRDFLGSPLRDETEFVLA
jgi:hypothetical protein